MLEHGDTVSIGGTTLRAVHNPGHTQGTTNWMMTVEDGGRRYNVAILGSMLPDWGVSLIKNPRHKNVVADTRLGLSRLKPRRRRTSSCPAMRSRSSRGSRADQGGVRPHPLLSGDEWMSDIMEAEADLERAVWAEEQARESSKPLRRPAVDDQSGRKILAVGLVWIHSVRSSRDRDRISCADSTTARCRATAPDGTAAPFDGLGNGL